MKSKLEFIQRGGVTKRYHVMDTLKSQSVAEHSFGVAWLVWLLCMGRPSVELVMAALQHDLAEHITGDLPAPAKRDLRISAQFAKYEAAAMGAATLPLIQLTTSEARTLKFADTCELLLFCLREISLGNAAMWDVFERGVGYIHEMNGVGTKPEQELLSIIGDMRDELDSKR